MPIQCSALFDPWHTLNCQDGPIIAPLTSIEVELEVWDGFFLSSGFHGGFSIFWDFGGIHTPQKLPSFIELDDGKIYRKTLYLMVKTMVSCRFSLKPILWIIFPIILWSSDPYSILTGSYELRATNWGKPVSMVKMFGYRKFQWDSHHYGKKNHQNGDLEGVYHIYDICVSYGIVGF